MKKNHVIIVIVISLAFYFTIVPLVIKVQKALECEMDFINPSDDKRFSKLFQNWADKSYIYEMGMEKGEYALFSFEEQNEHFFFHTFEMSGRDIYGSLNFDQIREVDKLPDFLDSGAGYRTRTMDISHEFCFTIPSEVKIKIDGEVMESFSGDSVRIWNGYFRKLVIFDRETPLLMFTDTEWNIGSKEVLVALRKEQKLFLTIIKGTIDTESANKAINMLNLGEPALELSVGCCE